jgi:hypothetical protein
VAWNPEDCTWSPASTCFTGAEIIAAIGTAVSLGTTVAGTLQSRSAAEDQAASQSTALQAKAAADRMQANQEAAVAQRQAIDDRRKTQLVQSQLQARAAAGGGSAVDPSILTLSQGIAGQGEYNALSKLAAGETSGAALDYQATLDEAQAARYRRAGDIAANAALFSGLGTLSSNVARSPLLFPRSRGTIPEVD